MIEKHSTTATSLAIPLKDSTRPSLLLVLLGNIAVFYGVVKTGTIVFDGVLQLTQDWHKLVPAGAAFVLVSVLNELLDPTSKARLVFWRWHDPLPGNRAFTKYAFSDPQVNVKALKRVFGPLPKDPHEQNAVWYRLYKSIAHDPSVLQVHRKYLFTRDYAAGSALFLITLGPIGFWAIPSISTAFLYIALLAFQYLLTRRAARNNGIRLVTTVLAIKAAR
jgi:hypothetical protein